MSKYIKLEDAIERLNELYHGYEVEEWLKHLPTIEVSEDCIDRKKLLEQIDKDSEGSPGYYRDTWQFIKTIENAPSVVPKARPIEMHLDVTDDVVDRAVEQIRAEGEWLPIVEGDEFGEAYIAGIYCSECGETLGFEANYCPNCGAKMKG